MRFTLLRALGTVACAALFVAGALYIASDYARLQFLRAKEYFWMQELRTQRDTLHRTNRSLKLKVKGLSTDNARIVEYERSIQERLDRLSAVLNSAKSLGVLGEKDLPGYKKAAANQTRGGVGGLELDCIMSDSLECLNPDGKWDSASERAVIKLPANDTGNLVEMLDGYIAALRIIPFAYPASGRITSPFGMRLSPFGRHGIKHHEGVDIGLDYGAPVYATADGVVKHVKRSRTYGLYVDVRHSTRVYTRYAHLSKALVRAGQQISGDVQIGLAGSSGRSTGPHVHYEVRVDGKAKNPEQLFRLGRALRDVLDGDA